MIPELDVDQLDADLYKAWQQIQKRNYGTAEDLVSKSWRQVRIFRLCLPAEPRGKKQATTDRDLRALITKTLYAVLNRLERFPDVRQCHKDGLECEYVYPYGFVPEGGCPRHDP